MTKLIDVVLLGGGKGSRFQAVTHGKMSKALYQLNGKELIRYSLDSLDFSLVNKLIIAIDTGGVREWAEQQDFPVEVIFSEQIGPSVLGAVSAALEHVETESFLLCNTDEVREGLTLRSMILRHEANPNVLATMALTHQDRLYRHRVNEIDGNGIVTTDILRGEEFREKPELMLPINTGYVIFRKNAALHFDSDRYAPDWSALVSPLINKKVMQGILYPDLGYFNVGTPEELADALLYFQSKATSLVPK